MSTVTKEEAAVARLVELRDEMERTLEEENDEPWPHWWPALDLTVGQLHQGSEYSLCNLARLINNLPIGPRYGELREEIQAAAHGLIDVACGSGGESRE